MLVLQQVTTATSVGTVTTAASVGSVTTAASVGTVLTVAILGYLMLFTEVKTRIEDRSKARFLGFQNLS